MVTQKMEKEREESQRRFAAKDKLLSKRALHINTLQGINNSYSMSSETNRRRFHVNVRLLVCQCWINDSVQNLEK